MCGTLWRDELYEIARLHQVQVKGRALVTPLTNAICDHMPVPRIHDAMIEELRRRDWKGRKRVIDTRGAPPMSGTTICSGIGAPEVDRIRISAAQEGQM
jgi:hypothetical protein